MSRHPVLSTYRVQLRPEFGFDDAAAIVPYLADLGTTHLYTSPYLQAAAGSSHGYDTVDYSKVNAELGGEAGRLRLCDALQANGMGHIIDIVPNHMCISSPANQWWWNVLRHGSASAYAGYFDIDWSGGRGNPPGKVVLPVLGEPLTKALADGLLTLDQSASGPVIRYFNAEFPICNADVANSSELRNVLDRQHYVLTDWRTGARRINYRRFFDINTLAGLCIERDDVFDDVHRLPLQWVSDGSVQGLRVDHVDGLRDPTAYLERLRSAVGDECLIIVEKILQPHEQLPSTWPVSGTTGYDAGFITQSVFTNGGNTRQLSNAYTAFTGVNQSWSSVVAEAKAIVLADILIGDVDRLTELLVVAAERHGYISDASTLARALTAVLAAFPVYRTYAAPETGCISAADIITVDGAVAEASADVLSPVDRQGVAFVGDLLTLRVASAEASEFVVCFQQLSGPVMAKSVEDTSFYRYNRFVAANEVGGDPAVLGLTTAKFHEACTERQRSYPLSLVATTTHDTKRSEDVRYRLAALSEMAGAWDLAAGRWQSMNAAHASRAPDGDGRLPDANMEYMLYQTLIGAHPLSVDRATEYASKASKEAKVFTSWNSPDQTYDCALQAFVVAVLSDEAFAYELDQFTEALAEAELHTTLAATLVKLTQPGVPDTYQGTELTDLSLVDPDNRRTVDYGRRIEALRRVRTMEPEELLAASDIGLVKIRVITDTLRIRARRPGAFGPQGAYAPIVPKGHGAEHVIAFLRGERIITLAPRLTESLRRNGGWQNTMIDLPSGEWKNVFTGEYYGGGPIQIEKLLARFPVALLEAEAV